jgi:tripartite-type tricarboxylate transporter receptor subunit TctC
MKHEMKWGISIRRRMPLLIVLLSALMMGFPGWNQEVHAQAYPARPINMLIGFAPGAATDICARLIAKAAEKFLGQEIVPINKPGAGGAVAAGIMASSKGDGYTILADVSAALTNAPHMETVNFDPLKDFVFLFQYGVLIPIYVVPSESPHKSFKDAIEFARKNPGKFSVGTPGVGTSPHLAMDLIKSKEKVDVAVIPFAGSAPAMTSLLGGHISCVGTSTPTAIPHIKANKVRAIAITSEQRDEATPGVPTLKELGYTYAVLEEVFFLAAPKGTPPAVAKKLEDAFRKAWETPEYRTKTKALYTFPENPLYADKLKTFIEQEYKRNGEIIKGAKLDN